MAKGFVEKMLDQQPRIDSVADVVQPMINGLFNNSGAAGRAAKDALNGVWLGHPLHPVITDVPIGAWTTAQVLDLASAARGDDAGLDAASDLALGLGIVAAVGAAVTGFTDWSEIGGAPRRLGLVHGLINTVGLACNLGSLALRLRGGDRGLARGLSATGYVIAGVAAYIGGDLVYKVGQSVNRDAWVEGPEEWTDAAAAADLADGALHRYDVAGARIVLIRHPDGIHAVAGTCPHVGGPLWEGTLEDHCLTCPWHGSQFDIRDGRLLHGPSTYPIPSYEVREQGGRILIRLEP